MQKFNRKLLDKVSSQEKKIAILRQEKHHRVGHWLIAFVALSVVFTLSIYSFVQIAKFSSAYKEPMFEIMNMTKDGSINCLTSCGARSDVVASSTEQVTPRTKSEEAVASSANDALASEAINGTVEEQIEYWANYYKVDVNLSKAIAWCETRYLNVCNYQYGCWKAAGIYQFTPKTWNETRLSMGLYVTDRMNIWDNIQTANYLLSTKGTRPWLASQGCWSKR